MFKPASVLILFTLTFSCAQNIESKKKVNSKKLEEKESANAKVNKPKLFPVIMAGSIGLIQKIYLKKAE